VVTLVAMAEHRNSFAEAGRSAEADFPQMREQKNGMLHQKLTCTVLYVGRGRPPNRAPEGES